MRRRDFLKQTAMAGSLLAMTGLSACNAGKMKPNFVLIFTDDQGYADVGCFGARGFQTPNIDEMAKNGRKFTDFHVTSSICSPSRASLMTGCYPQRVGLPHVLFPEGPEWTKDLANIGLNPKETTIAEILKEKEYATACFGKWHMGDRPKFLPTNHGFDEYFGLPYSNDMRPENNPKYPPLPLIEGIKTIEENPDQTDLTKRYTERAIDFIDRNKDQPFFLYLAQSMPHVPLFRSKEFQNTTEQGAYGDVIAEIDWSVGQVIKRLRKHNLEKNTLVIFTTDNGPWTVFGNHGGSAEPLRGCKQTTFEGGQRVPCIMQWDGKIPANTLCKELATTMDILPTFASLADAPLPENKIDGHNIENLIFSKRPGKSPYEVFYYYFGNDLQAVRSGKWKLHLPHRYRGVKKAGMDGEKGKYFFKEIDLSLFDLEKDIAETTNIADQHSDIVEKLLLYADKAKATLGDMETPGIEVRDCGRITKHINN